MLDRYLQWSATRLCQEAPVPVVTIADCQNVPGGAANTAVNLRSLGAQVSLISAIGDDWEGTLLRQSLLKHGVSADHIGVGADRSTLTKQRVMNGSNLLLRFDQGSPRAIAPDLEQQVIDQLNERFPQSDAVLISDYGYGILTPRVIQAIAHLQSQSPRTLVVDSKNLPAYRCVKPTAVKPNYHQALQLLGETDINDQSPADWIVDQTDWILNLTGAKIAAVTLDRDGAVILQRPRSPYRLYANPSCQSRTIGAGDTFAAMLTIALAAKAPVNIAADLAAAAAIVVNKDGTSTCTIPELHTFFSAYLKA